MSYYDQAKADRAVAFFNNLIQTKGRFAGKHFQLRPWQENEIIRPLFGIMNDDTGLRQYKQCLVTMARKNGKSELAAGVALYLLCADGEEGAEVYGAAVDEEQAGVVFRTMAATTRRTPALNARLKVVDFSKRILYPANGSFYRALPGDAKALMGLNIHGLIYDEGAFSKTRDLMDTLTTASGTRDQALFFFISTASWNRSGWFYELYEYAKKVKKDPSLDPTFLPCIWEVPEDAGDVLEDETLWPLSNPGLGDFRSLKDLQNEAAKARLLPTYKMRFKILYANQWVSSSSEWLPMDKWDANINPVDAKELLGKPCYCGLDMALTTDLAAFVAVFPYQSGTDKAPHYKVMPFFFIPEKLVAEKSKIDKYDYVEAIRLGHLIATPGDQVDFDFVENFILNFSKNYKILEFALDKWGVAQMMQHFQDAGLKIVEIEQKAQYMSPAMKQIEVEVANNRIDHGGQPLLREHLNNVTPEYDEAGRIKPNKRKNTEKIDGAVAMILAVGRIVANPLRESAYEHKGITYI